MQQSAGCKIIRLKGLLTVLFLFAISFVNGQVDYFNVMGKWAGNDVNGNAVIKWNITICANSDTVTGLFISIPPDDKGEGVPGSAGQSDEDGPGQDDNCASCRAWNYSDWNNPPYNNNTCKQNGRILENGILPAYQCRTFSWITYSKDYDSDGTDYDHYTTAAWKIGSPPTDFNCDGDHKSCIEDTGCRHGCPANCVDMVDCDDVTTDNYEQILGLAVNRSDGPNLHPEGYWDFQYSWVTCHHGESDYIANADLIGPCGWTNFHDVIPDTIVDIEIVDNMANDLVSAGGEFMVQNILYETPGRIEYNSGWGYPNFTSNILNVKATSFLPPGQKEVMGVSASRPECDSLKMYFEWRPTKSEAMCRYYGQQPTAQNWVGKMGCQFPTADGCSINHCITPVEISTTQDKEWPDPDPEFGDHTSTAFSTCSAGPAEDCDGEYIYMCYAIDVAIDKNTLNVVPSADLNPNHYDVTYEIIVTNTGSYVLNANHILNDDLTLTYGAGVGTAYTIVTPPTLDLSVVPAPTRGDQGFPTLNPAWDGDNVKDMIDHSDPHDGPQDLTTSAGIVYPGKSFRLTYTVQVDRSVIGTTQHDNTASIEVTDPNSIMTADATDSSPMELPTFDMALTKTTSQTAPVADGDLVAFTINIYNQGEGTISKATICDYIPSGYTFVQALNPGWTLAGNTACTDWTGTMASGGSDMVQITLKVNGHHSDTTDYHNYAEITQMWDDYGVDRSTQDEDSEPGSNSPEENAVNPGDPGDNDTASTGRNDLGSEDDHDPAGIPFIDLALKKELDAGSVPPFRFGDVVTFNITIENQGNTCAQDIEVTDYIPAGFELAAGSPWTYDAATHKAKIVYAGPLCPTETHVLTIDSMLLRSALRMIRMVIQHVISIPIGMIPRAMMRVELSMALQTMY